MISMIKPHKYLDINYSVIVVGSKILSIFRKKEKMKYELVLEKLIKNGGEENKYVFPQALSFLYLLGKVDYCKETDELELLI